MKPFVLFALLACSLAPAAAAQTGARRLTARDLVSVRVPESLEPSPDGASVLFSLAEPDFERSRVNRDLYVARIGDGRASVRRLTWTPDADETSPRYSPDGAQIAFVSDRAVPDPDAEPAGDDEEPKKQVWVMPVDGGEARPLTSAEEGVFDLRWTPDGRSVVYTAREVLPKPESERKADEKKRKRDATVVDAERYRREFWTVSVATGEARRIHRGDYGVGAFDVAPDGRELVFETNLTGRGDDEKLFDLYLLPLAGGEPRRLTSRAGAEHQPQYSPDGKWVAFAGPVDGRYEYSRYDAFVVSAAGGEPRNVSAALDRSVERVAWMADSRHLAATVVDGVYQPVYRFDAAPGSASKPVRLTSQPLVALEAVPLRTGRLALVAETATAAPELWVAAETGASPLTELNREVATRAVARQEAIRWRAPDGTEIEGVLVYPIDHRPGARAPLVVAIHGGPNEAAQLTLRGYYYHPQLWAAAGYAVLLPNYRGSDGYGDAFGQANRGDLAGKDYLDIMAGVDRVVEMGVADPERMGIMGLSYGGYMTNWAITRTDRFKAAISESGIFNLITDYSNSIYPSWEPDYLNGFYWEQLELYLERSPARYVERIKTPVLIMHGEEDTNTFISNSKEMYQALKSLGRTAEFVTYPREEHGFEEPNHRVDSATRWVAWFDRYVRGGARPLYAAGEFAPAGTWEYAVASVDAVASYAGRRAAGRFVEIALMLRGEPGRSAPGEVASRDVALVLADGRELRPLGTVTAAAGARAVVAGDATVRLEADPDAARTYVPIVLAFDVPKEAAGARVRLGAHPEVAVDLEAGAN